MISIQGGGIAACCSYQLLRRARVLVARVSGERPKVPAVMLSETTQKLLGDVFERSDLFAGLHRIRRRVVQWGAAEPMALPHAAVVVSEEALFDRLQAELPERTEDRGPAAWTIVTSRARPAPSAGPATECPFGSRLASASAVTLRTEAASESCWIESLAVGWLFLLPCSLRKGWVIAVGGKVEPMLEESRLVGAHIAERQESTSGFPSHPRIGEPLSAPGWLACGSAALAFDPLCGEGVANATREAILASAVVRASLGGADANQVAEHYRVSLIGGFRRHLALCKQFYESGGSAPWWKQQVHELDRGLEWTGERLGQTPEFRFRLNGFNLESQSEAVHG